MIYLDKEENFDDLIKEGTVLVDFYATLEPDLVFPRKIIDKKKAVLRLHHN